MINHLFFGVIASLLSFAQPDMPTKTDFEVIREQGSLFSIKLIPGEPLKIFVLGNEEATVDLSKTNWKANVDLSNLSVSVKQTNPSPGKILKIKRLDNHFIVDDPLQLSNGTELHLQIRDKDKKTHSFRVRVKK